MNGIGFVGGFGAATSLKQPQRCRIRGRNRFCVKATISPNPDMVKVTEPNGDWILEGTENYQLSLGERSRTVVHTCPSGTMCTSSTRHGGVPFGSHVDYVLDEEGRPLFLLANSAAHTKNLKEMSRISLFCQPSTNSGQSGGRTTLLGNVSRVSRLDIEELVDSFVMKHPHAAEALSYTDNFHFYRMEVEDVYFVGGYGVAATWVDVEEYNKAKPDPIATEATKLIERLNTSGSDDMRRLCSIFCGIDEEFEATVVALDRLGLDIRVTTEKATKEFRICFREDIGNSFDAQSSLVKLLQEAWEKENGFEEEWEGAPDLKVIRYFWRKREQESGAGQEITG